MSERETYLNSPVKNCMTCAHRDGEMCVKQGFTWDSARRAMDERCDDSFSGWRMIPPKPPAPERRSLRAWLAALPGWLYRRLWA